MKKPIAPSRPKKPTEPLKKINNIIRTEFSDEDRVIGKTFKELCEVLCVNHGIDSSTVDISKIKVTDITFSDSDYWGREFGMEISYDAGERDNPFYEKELEKYENDMVSYERKLSEYNRKIRQHKKDMLTYEEFFKQEEIKKALDILKKHNKLEKHGL